MINPKLPLTQFALALCCILQQTDASATSLEKQNFRQMVQDAELIFEGVVTKVAYKNAHPYGSDGPAIPHTFVTFQIDQAFKGSSEKGNEITLRFEGGSAGQQQVMFVPNVPLFDVGERNVLFVKNNGAAPCPLVGWDQGRMREVGSRLLSENGQELWLDKRQNVVSGAYQNDAEIWNHQMGDQVFSFDLPAEIKQESWTPPKGAKKLDAASIGTVIADTLVQVRQLESQRHLAPADLHPARSANIAETLQMQGVAAAPPPGSVVKSGKAEAPSADAWETDLLKQSHGDPTLNGQETRPNVRPR